MLTFSSDFWPLFWTILGSGAALTVVLTALIAVLPRYKRHGTPVAATSATAGHDDFDGYLSRAA
jgi:hypothetical protein